MLFSCEETDSFQCRRTNTTQVRVFVKGLPKTKRLHGVLGCAAFARAWRHSCATVFSCSFTPPSVVSRIQDVTCWPAGPPWADIALPGTAKTSTAEPERHEIVQLGEKFDLAVRQHLAHFRRVKLMHGHDLLQPPHTIRRLRPQQMPLSGMHPKNLAGLRDLESLRGASV
jgi:hypothetical protein